MSKIIDYHKIQPEHLEKVGGKAYRLAQLHQHKILTSPFFVISTEIAESGKLSISQEVEIIKKAKKFQSNRYAVRSSANCEDGSKFSFAGQFSTYLSLTLEEIIPAIYKCWNSIETESVKAYCRYHQIDHSTIKMAVIIQEMIPAEIGGVLFTKDPFQNRNSIVIEAAKGLGEQIVSGSIDSTKYVLDKKSGRVKEGGVDLPKSVLSSIQLNKLFQIGRQIEQLFCFAQDIEWAYYQNQLYILQSRPIT